MLPEYRNVLIAIDGSPQAEKPFTKLWTSRGATIPTW
ncbi:universal stress protein [Neisseria iguanae]|nr:universal stress protein [Neisseria iguanae]